MSGLREMLERVAPSLRPIAQDVLADTIRIDLVAVADDGRVVAVFDARHDELSTFTRALGSLSWLEAHLPDWVQIAPDLAIDSTAPPCSLLLAPAFRAETRAAADRIAGAPVLLLAIPEAFQADEFTIRPTARPEPARTDEQQTRPPEGPPARGPRHPFRTQLRNRDLGADPPRPEISPRGER